MRRLEVEDVLLIPLEVVKESGVHVRSGGRTGWKASSMGEFWLQLEELEEWWGDKKNA